MPDSVRPGVGRQRRWLVLAAGAVALAVLWWLLGESAGARTGRTARTGTAPLAGEAPDLRTKDGDAVGSTAAVPPGPRWTLRVRVLLNGEPVSGATVSAFAPRGSSEWSRLEEPDSAPVATGETGIAGIAVLDLAQPGTWHLVARRPGSAPGLRDVHLARPVSAVPVEIHLRAACALEGRVRDEGGAPVANAVVRAGALSQYAPRRAANARTRTDADGRFRFSDLPAGRTQVAAGDPAGHSVFVELPFRGSCELVLRERGRLAGVVTDVANGRPLAGVVLRIEGPGAIGHVVTDEEGRYEWRGLRSGRIFRIAVRAAGYVPLHESGVPGPADGSLPLDPVVPQRRGTRLALTVTPGQTTRYDIALRRGARLVGRVTGPDGPVADALVTIVTGKGQNGYFAPEARTDGEGRYRIDGLLDGPVLVHAKAEGLIDPHRTRFWKRALRKKGAPGGAGARVVVPKSGVVEKDIVLVAGASLRGRVETEDGEPLPDAYVYAYQGSPVSRSAEIRADASGRFVLVGLSPDAKTHVSARAPGWIMDEPVIGKPAVAAPEMVLRVARAPRVFGRVTDATGAPVAGGRIDVLQQSSSRAPGPLVLADPTPTDPSGRYERFLRSRKDAFRIRAVSPGLAPATSPSVSPAAGVRSGLEVNLVLAAGALLSGRVLSAAGEPVSHAQIRVASGTGYRGYPWHLPVAGASDADGFFRVPVGRAERARVFVSAQGFRPANVVLPVDPPAEIRLDASRSIRGRVRGRDGAPVSGIRIGAFAAEGRRWDVYWFQRPGTLRSDGLLGRVEAATGADGSFELRDLRDGSHRLLVLPGAATAPRVRTVRDHVVRAGDHDVVVHVEPAPADAFFMLSDEDLGRAARYWEMRKRSDRAAAMWRALVARAPGAARRVEAMNELARTLAALGVPGLEERERVAREATALVPAATASGRRARLHLAAVTSARGRPAEALALAREVAGSSGAASAMVAEARLIAGHALAELGRRDEARTEFERALEAARAAKDGALAGRIGKARDALGSDR